MNAERSKYWTTQDGTTVPIRDMSNAHLMNTIAMLVRNHESRIETGMRITSDPCGLCGTVNFRIGWVKLPANSHPTKTFPIYRDLILEARKRGLV